MALEIKDIITKLDTYVNLDDDPKFGIAMSIAELAEFVYSESLDSKIAIAELAEMIVGGI